MAFIFLQQVLILVYDTQINALFKNLQELRHLFKFDLEEMKTKMKVHMQLP